MSITERLRQDAAEALGLDDVRLRELQRQPAEADAGDVKLMAEQLLTYRHLRKRQLSNPDLIGDVESFNRKFDLPVGPETLPRLLPADVQEYRERFLDEELREFKIAWARGDLLEAADALCDLVYVAIGTAHFMGLPFAQHWNEVQRANMAKVRGLSNKPRVSGLAEVNRAFEAVKPADWPPPDHRRVLREHDYVYARTDT